MDVAFVECLACGSPAEMVSSVELASTDGPVTVARVRCVLGHRRVVPAIHVRPPAGTVDTDSVPRLPEPG